MAIATSPTIDKTDEQKAITDMVRQFADERDLFAGGPLGPRARAGAATRAAERSAGHRRRRDRRRAPARADPLVLAHPPVSSASPDAHARY